ncbi:hypothetical protein C8J56DRAFT_261659 [Mycena floridula]|nr:hypothetical protein C8J56DRAFT_261659 [Mycena floridula]
MSSYPFPPCILFSSFEYLFGPHLLHHSLRLEIPINTLEKFDQVFTRKHSNKPLLVFTMHPKFLLPSLLIIIPAFAAPAAERHHPAVVADGSDGVLGGLPVVGGLAGSLPVVGGLVGGGDGGSGGALGGLGGLLGGGGGASGGLVGGLVGGLPIVGPLLGGLLGPLGL